MSSTGGLEDFSLVDLFRSEVETHSEVLGSALLALERSPGDTSRVDEMMRAAHSIKGAARVVGVDPAVSVAHVMEDCFVAAQKGKLTLSPADVDVLLRGVDLLGKISEATRDPQTDLATVFEAPVRSLVAELEAMLTPGPRPEPAAVASASAESVPPPAPTTPVVAPASPKVERAAEIPSATTLTFPEWLDEPSAESLRQRFLDAIERGSGTIRLDLRATKDLGVPGLVLLASLPRHVAGLGQTHLRVVGISPELETVLSVTGLAQAYGLSGGKPAGDV